MTNIFLFILKMCGYILTIILGFILACGITNAVTKKAKKPKGEIDSYDDFDCSVHYCPNCKNEVDEAYCPACGQKIDWSE